MTGSLPPSLESLEYLFQTRSQLSKQVSPHAPFAVTSAVDGNAGFLPQTSPSQVPKKRKILLDYNSSYRLWHPNEMALEIAKLKQEGFEVAVYNELSSLEAWTQDKSKDKTKILVIDEFNGRWLN